ncbi:PAS domain S-box-containing protein/diguanylate cyclase (GGDEF) domain-containing protein [Marinobacterium lutimaris]|uniref:cyclic-guanylate-specific phosphodiesterase n=1 Tax=Marinobacterium lutimaris TaxID=568106 RepID=A0A1H6D120_9GAMM|nr:PAS domain S-box-containing protein/diguanylate cyclase (GGDEF) domain-containing protein [Marinobacterium lutimaris]
MGACLFDSQGRCLAANRALSALISLPSPLHQLSRFFLDSASSPDLVSRLGALFRGDHAAFSLPYYRIHNDAPLDLELHVSAVHDTNGNVSAALVLVTDERIHHLRELELKQFSNAVENSGSAVVITDSQGRIEYINSRFTDISGYTLSEVIGHQPSFLKSGNTPGEVYANLWATVLSHRKWRGTLHNRRKDGELYWSLQSISPILNEDGKLTNIVSVSDDITQLKEHQQQMERLAFFDPLTDLGNRRNFRDHLEELLHSRGEGISALLLLDLDHFKKINDTMGHEAGDTLLRSVASRLRFCINPPHTVHRLGGDEFTVLLRNLSSIDAVRNYCDDIIELLAQPLDIGTHQIQVTVSVGITLLGVDAVDVSGLLRNADLAMYRAKHVGRNTYQFYSAEMNAEAHRALTLEHDLRQALDRGELKLVYQPQIDLKSGALVGIEALLRWNHPQEGPISPAEFIPMAEETGLIVSIGRWVLLQACRHAAKLRQHLDAPFRVAVNLSARQFDDLGLAATVKSVLEETELPASFLELEITEGLMIDNYSNSLMLLHKLRDLGITLAIDDFGTGYSSLSYLKKMPVQVLKIDRSFVQDLPDDRDDLAITSTIILMARQLGLQVLAEGIETSEQHQFLLNSGCPVGQGFLFDRPLPLEEIIQRYSQETLTAPQL